MCARGTGPARKACATATNAAAKLSAAAVMCNGSTVSSAAAWNRTSAASADGSSRGYAIQAAAVSETSGGSANAASTRCAVSRAAAPLTTASSVVAAAKSAVSRNQGPGGPCNGLLLGLAGTGLRESAPQVAQRPGTRHVRHPVEVVRRRRRGRVPLEGIRQPGIVPGPSPRPRRLDDVDEEEREADRHHAGADRREQVVGLEQPVPEVREVAARHPHQAE